MLASQGCRRALVILLLAFVTAPAATAEAAKPDRKKAIWGPVRFEGRSQFPIYRELGVGIYEYALGWADVAPTRPADPRNPDDPAYRWPEELDFAARESRRTGIELALMTLRTPAWANAGQADNVPPSNPRDYGDFVEAVSRRYPRVRHWLIWGEPIRFPRFLVHFSHNEQRTDNSALDATQREDARKYSELVDVAYGRLKRRSRRNLIIGGNTTTIGDWFGPEQWIKNLRLGNGKPPRMDLYGHNPFGTRTPDLSNDQIIPGTADFSDLDVLAGWLDRYLHRRGRNRRLPIFISEYSAPTEVPGPEFNYHVTRRLQAKWLSAGLRITRRWSRIYTFGWFGLRDPSPVNDFESRLGLIDGTGRRKPAFDAYLRG